MMKGEDFYKLLGALYDLREKTFDTEEEIATLTQDSLSGERLKFLLGKLEDFDCFLSEQIVELLKYLLEEEQCQLAQI